MPDFIRVNGERLLNRIKELGNVGALEGGGCCRLALSDEDRQGRDLVISWMKDLGLTISTDQIGNVFGTREGEENLPPVMTGSHIDTVRTGGIYDGNLGVLAGLEVIECLNEANIRTRRPVCVAFFTNEEGARFAPDMMGSLVYVGGMPLEEALNTQGIDGSLVGDCLKNIGAQGDAPVGSPNVHSFIELHIEQGPILEERGVTIGAVDKVQGISWQEFTFRGVSNHAGTTPMRLRHDAGYAAMETGAFVRKLVSEMGGDQIGTVGSFEVSPNLVNVVSNYAKITVDLRNTDNNSLQAAENSLKEFVEALAAKEGIDVSCRTLARFDPVVFDSNMVDKVENYAKSLGYSVMRLPSGAGHDAQMLARVCPTSMIFVPSAKGLSHNIDEHTDAEDLEAGANILLQVIQDVSSK